VFQIKFCSVSFPFSSSIFFSGVEGRGERFLFENVRQTSHFSFLFLIPSENSTEEEKGKKK
jgi:hypothetical protein